jgi:hypothetical protein
MLRCNEISRPTLLMGHLRSGHVDGMSVIAPIATDLLYPGNGRKGP